MNEILLGVFKRWICLIPAIIFWVLSHPVNLMFGFILEFLYWVLTGRSFMDDGHKFIK